MVVDLRKHHPFEPDLRWAMRMCALNVVLTATAIGVFAWRGGADVSSFMGVGTAMVVSAWLCNSFRLIIKRYPQRWSFADWLIQTQVTRMGDRQSSHSYTE